MRILVIGGLGYIGSTLSSMLMQTDNHVTVIDNMMYKEQNVRALLSLMPFGQYFTFHQSDIRGVTETLVFRDAIKWADVVIPLAAIVGAPACSENPQLTKEINQNAIKNLVGMLSLNQRIIYPNTDSGYGDAGGELCTEETPFKPISVYSVTKTEAEKYVLDHNNAVSLRLATVYGVSPKMRFDLMVNDFTQKLFYHKKIDVFDPYLKRNFVHVRDVSSAFHWMILARPELTGVYNVGLDDANLTKLQLAELISKYVFKSRVTKGQGIDPDRRNYNVSNQKLYDTGFVCEHSLEYGINQILTLCKLVDESSVKKMRNI